MKRGKWIFRTDHRGFSLVELIIVISIMAVLSAVLVPMYLSYVEKANIARDMDTLNKIQKGLTLEYVLGQYTAESLMLETWGERRAGNEDMDINTKGKRIVQVNSDGTIQTSHGSTIEYGGYIYRALEAAGIDADPLTKSGNPKVKVFHSKALSDAIKYNNRNGYKHIMMSMTKDDVIRVWIGDQGYNNGKQSLYSLYDMRFAIGSFEYQ